MEVFQYASKYILAQLIIIKNGFRIHTLRDITLTYLNLEDDKSIRVLVMFQVTK